MTNSLLPTYKVSMNLLTTRDVAERLGITVQRVQALIKAERLPAQKIGRDYVIEEKALELVADRKPGRPAKQVQPGAQSTAKSSDGEKSRKRR